MGPTDHRKLIGAEAEQLAYDYLTEKGYHCLERNYRLRSGEIDLIMEDRSALVFIEVKYRRSLDYGTPEEAVTRLKAHRMTKAAVTYISEQKIVDRMIRFDVVAINIDGIHHLENAFEVTAKYYF